MLAVADVPMASISALLARYKLSLTLQADDEAITGSYWGDSEAGVIGHTVFVRNDTPIHSMLHETCHIICMSAQRRRHLETDAGGDDPEEAAVCYLQVLLADEIAEAGRERVMRDMDAWGYSFRLGDTASWFKSDAEDACKWLIGYKLLSVGGIPTFRLRD